MEELCVYCKIKDWRTDKTCVNRKETLFEGDKKKVSENFIQQEHMFSFVNCLSLHGELFVEKNTYIS